MLVSVLDGAHEFLLQPSSVQCRFRLGMSDQSKEVGTCFLGEMGDWRGKERLKGDSKIGMMKDVLW